jgi:hypothetical protein
MNAILTIGAKTVLYGVYSSSCTCKRCMDWMSIIVHYFEWTESQEQRMITTNNNNSNIFELIRLPRIVLLVFQSTKDSKQLHIINKKVLLRSRIRIIILYNSIMNTLDNIFSSYQPYYLCHLVSCTETRFTYTSSYSNPNKSIRISSTSNNN